MTGALVTIDRPLRTCVGCRRRRPQHALLRLGCREGKVVPARRDQRGGRGTYVCPARACFTAAVERRALSRGLGAGVGEAAPELWPAMQAFAAAELESLGRAGSGRRARRDVLAAFVGARPGAAGPDVGEGA